MAATAKGVVVTVLGQGDTETRRVFHGSTHEDVALHTVPVVGEEGDAECRHLGDRCELLPCSIDGDRCGGVDITDGRATEFEDFANDRSRVDRGCRVRYGENGGETTKGGTAGTGFDRFGLFLAGF